MDTNEKEVQSNNSDKKELEDIFAVSANPNVRLTPVDAKSATSRPDVKRIEFSETEKTAMPTAQSVLEPASKTRSSQKTNKVMVLMIGVIVFAILGGAGFVGYQFFTTSENSITVDEKVSENSQEDIAPAPSDAIDNESIETDVTLDTDKDGLTDARERELGLDIENSDTDGDGLSDKDEVDIYFTDPFNIDTDGDGFTDGSEVRKGFDPLGPGRLTDITKETL